MGGSWDRKFPIPYVRICYFLYFNARQRGPSPASQRLMWGAIPWPPRGGWRHSRQVGLYGRRKAGGPARLRSARVVQLLSRPVRPRTRYAALRSDWVRWLMVGYLRVTASFLTALMRKSRWPLALALPGRGVLAWLKKMHKEQRFLVRLLQMA